jgi:hypothetical protein
MAALLSVVSERMATNCWVNRITSGVTIFSSMGAFIWYNDGSYGHCSTGQQVRQSAFVNYTGATTIGSKDFSLWDTGKD